MKLHIVQHVPFEEAGNIKTWALEGSHSLSVTRVYEKFTLPKMEDFDLLFILGGPMSVHDEKFHPWLLEEKRYLEKIIKNGKGVMGICLGAQLMADVLGAKVCKNPHKEIGWFPVELTSEAASSANFYNLPKKITPFHWHGETFDLPQGSLRIASSKACLNQGFEYGRTVVGLQFHLETTEESVAQLVTHCSQEIKPGGYVQKAAHMLHQDKHLTNIKTILFGLLNNISAGIVQKESSRR